MQENHPHRFRSGMFTLCNQQGAVYEELLTPNKTVTADVYRCQLKKRLAIAANRRKIPLLQGNARQYVLRVVKNTLVQPEWDLPPHPAYSADIEPSGYLNALTMFDW